MENLLPYDALGYFSPVGIALCLSFCRNPRLEAVGIAWIVGPVGHFLGRLRLAARSPTLVQEWHQSRHIDLAVLVLIEDLSESVGCELEVFGGVGACSGDDDAPGADELGVAHQVQRDTLEEIQSFGALTLLHGEEVHDIGGVRHFCE